MSVKKRILKALGDKEVELGKCPYCLSENYSREGIELVEDNVRADCFCGDCEKDFTEWFGLDELRFKNEDSENVCFVNYLYNDEKEIIKKALEFWEQEEELRLSEREDCSRIKELMNGKCVEGLE